MPYKNKHKIHSPNSYYHVYARGINKMDIFKDTQDYKYFLHTLKKYLTKDFKDYKYNKFGEKIPVSVNSSYGLVELNAYCLIGNHFHFVLHNIHSNGMSKLMHKTLTSYSYYFNKKYKRQGPVIQGSYRAVPINSEQQMIIVGVYVHINPLKHSLCNKASEYEYSSYKYYFSNFECRWVSKNSIIYNYTQEKTLKRYYEKYDVTGYETYLVSNNRPLFDN